jgi:hypothetical protein
MSRCYDAFASFLFSELLAKLLELNLSQSAAETAKG